MVDAESQMTRALATELHGRRRRPACDGLRAVTSHRALTLLLATATPLAAQDATSPRGLVTTEGDASHFVLFHPGYERFMQIDDTWTGHAAAGLRAIGFRRDGVIANPLATARRVDLTVRLGRSDYAAAGNDFAANWAVPPTTVFTRKTINVPDWSSVAATAPAAFDLVLPFDTLHSYDGSTALAFELVMENTTGTSSADVDAERGTLPFRQAVGTTFDFGCYIRGESSEMAHSLTVQNHGPSHPQYGIRLGIGVIYAPAMQLAVANLDLSDPALVLPGLCAPIHALPLISLPLGVTSATGVILPRWFDVPHSPTLEGAHLFTQAIALHPQAAGIPVALSDRRDVIIPQSPRPSPACGYLYATQAGATTATFWRDRGIVVLLRR